MILEARGILDTDKIKSFTEKVFPIVFGGRLIVLGKEIIPEFMCSASLAYHGLLGSVDTMKLFGTDLSPVPPKHLASLNSCVTGLFVIRNVSGCDLVSFLTGLNCEKLSVNTQILGKEETQALVQSMESGVETVDFGAEATLDMEALADYSGLGRCNMISCAANNPDDSLERNIDDAPDDDSLDRSIEDAPYRNIDELMTWAKSRNWQIQLHEYIGNGFVIVNRRFQCRCRCHDANITVSIPGAYNCQCSCAQKDSLGNYKFGRRGHSVTTPRAPH